MATPHENAAPASPAYPANPAKPPPLYPASPAAPATPLMTTAKNAAPAKNAAAATPSFAAQAKAISDTGQYKATTGTFNEATGVEGRVNRISASDSPLMQLAGTRAKQAANSKGLLNTSMAVGAAQNAVLDAATPIAQADAGAYQEQQLANQDALNDAAMRNAAARAAPLTEAMKLGESSRQFEAAETGLNTRFDKQQSQQQGQFDKEFAQKESHFTRGMTHDVDMAKLDGQIRENLVGIEAKYKTEISSNENIANAWGTAMDQISKIQNNPDLDEATKQTLIENTLNGFKSFTGFWGKATGGAVDVSDLLNFGAGEAPEGGDFAKAPAGVKRSDLMKYQQGDSFDRTDWQRWADATGYKGRYFGIDAVPA